MAISQSKYVNIISSVGGGSSVNQRELIGRVFDDEILIPTGKVLEFGGGKANALPAIAEYFGMNSEEYDFAQKYFSFSTAANTEPKKISFARYENMEDDAHLISGKGFDLSAIQALTAGTFNLRVDGTAKSYTVNLSSATSLSDVANLMLAATEDSIVGFEYDIDRQRFIVSAELSITFATGTIAEALKLTSSEGFISEATEGKTPAECVAASAELSNNFFSFNFLGEALSVQQIKDVAEWVDSQNVKYMYSLYVTENPTYQYYETVQEAVKDYDGIALTLAQNPSDYVEFMPMSAFAAVDYTKPNSTMDVFYKQFKDVEPTVTSNAKRFVFDPLRINYYGATQQAGQMVSFYQDGVLQGSIPSMTVYANEAWLKDSFITDILNLRMGLDSLPANNTGKSLVLSALMETVNMALLNGVVLAGKELDASQKAYITTITGDEDGWIAVQNAGYRLSAEIERYEEYGITKYKISFLFIYSKGDTINYVDGRNILI